MKQDQITLDRIESLHPALREEARNMYKEMCETLTGRAMLRFSYTLRTYAEQNILYAQGRSNPGKVVTNAKGGRSFHNFGLSYDIVLLVDKDGNGSYESASWETDHDFDGDGKADWMEVVAIAKQHGWEWGGDWKFSDTPHFQKTFGLTVVELDRRVQAKLVIVGTNYPKLNAV